MFSNIKYRGLLCVVITILISCSQRSNLYKSSCDKEKTYQKININDLLENINDFQGKYVEIVGKYRAGFEESALYSENNEEKALWVRFDDFNSVCPLISTGTKINLFGKEQAYEDLYNKLVILHGRINIKKKGHLSQYKASIEDITLVDVE